MISPGGKDTFRYRKIFEDGNNVWRSWVTIACQCPVETARLVGLVDGQAVGLLSIEDPGHTYRVMYGCPRSCKQFFERF